MAEITLDDISLSFSEKPLLDGVNASIFNGDKIALIGRNGEGKSTLIKVLAGIIKPDDGEIRQKTGLTIGYLDQTLPADNDKTVYEIVSSGLGDVGKLILNYQNALNTEDHDKAGIIQHQIDELNAWSTFHEIHTLLDKFELDSKQKVSELSGGWKRRLMLSKALISNPDVLLLDEPTNHMDINSIIYLENYLKNFTGILVLISHDRSFVDAIVNRVFDLDRGFLTTFNCGFKDYLVRKDNLLNSENIANQKFEKKLAQEEIWIRQGIKARRTRNEGRVRALKEMRNQFINKRTKQGTVKIQDINEDVKRNSKLIFELKNISYSFDDNQLIQDFSQIILKGEKIGIFGGNGVGKTTLIKLLLDQLAPTKGAIRRSKNIELAYFDQINESFNPEMKAMDFVSGGKEYIDIGGKNKHIIGYLRQFLFTGKQAMSPIRMFSGGEKNRLLLAKILSKPANLIILDEPTNDLDVETLELLEEMLVEYKGTLIVISHDRTFLNNVVSSTIVMNGNSDIKHYAGGYDDYLQSTNQAKKQSHAIIKSSPLKKKVDDILSRDERKELGRLPKLIEKKEIEIGQLQLKLSDANAYKDKMYKKNIEELAALEDELNFLYDRWSELEKRN